MAVAPLFFETLVELQSVLRLPEVQIEQISDTVASQIQAARADIYSRLGATRVTALVGTTYAENAATEAELDKIRARQLEAALVRLKLTYVLPTLWLDAADARQTTWNEDSFSRELGGSPRDPLRDLQQALQLEVDRLFAELESDDYAGETTRGRVASIGPTDDPPTPYDTIRNTFTRGVL